MASSLDSWDGLFMSMGPAGIGLHTPQKLGSVGQRKITGLRQNRLTFWKYCRFIAWGFTHTHPQNRYFQSLHMASSGSLRPFLFSGDFNPLTKYQLFFLEYICTFLLSWALGRVAQSSHMASTLKRKWEQPQPGNQPWVSLWSNGSSSIDDTQVNFQKNPEVR